MQHGNYAQRRPDRRAVGAVAAVAPTTMDRSQTIVRILSWAAHDDNIRAVVATGSFARDTMDPYSDLDIELYVGEPAQLLDQDKWYQQFGTVLVVEALENQGWNPTRLVYYAGGKTDFKILAASLLQRGVEFVLSVCS